MQLTVRDIRDLIDGLADDVPVQVAVADSGEAQFSQDVTATVFGSGNGQTVMFGINVDDLG